MTIHACLLWKLFLWKVGKDYHLGEILNQCFNIVDTICQDEFCHFVLQT